MSKLNKNRIELTGTVDNLKDHILKIPRPLTCFNLLVHRPVKVGGTDSKIDIIQLRLFNDEIFYKTFKNSDRIKVSGFLQSRNYTEDNNQVNDLLEKAVQFYMEFFDEFPTVKEPIGNKREYIEWSKLIDAGLLKSIPRDSLYINNGQKNKDINKTFSYRMDKSKLIYKESQHVSYEVVIEHYEKLDEELNLELGDTNKVEMVGEITKKNTHYKDDNVFQVTNMRVKTFNNYYVHKRIFYNNAIIWEDSQLSKTASLTEGDYVSIYGRLQSREYLKEVSLTSKTRSGNVKRKKVVHQFSTHEISVSKLKKVEVRAKRGVNNG